MQKLFFYLTFECKSFCLFIFNVVGNLLAEANKGRENDASQLKTCLSLSKAVWDLYFIQKCLKIHALECFPSYFWD